MGKNYSRGGARSARRRRRTVPAAVRALRSRLKIGREPGASRFAESQTREERRTIFDQQVSAANPSRSMKRERGEAHRSSAPYRGCPRNGKPVRTASHATAQDAREGRRSRPASPETGLRTGARFPGTMAPAPYRDRRDCGYPPAGQTRHRRLAPDWYARRPRAGVTSRQRVAGDAC